MTDQAPVISTVLPASPMHFQPTPPPKGARVYLLVEILSIRLSICQNEKMERGIAIQSKSLVKISPEQIALRAHRIDAKLHDC